MELDIVTLSRLQFALTFQLPLVPIQRLTFGSNTRVRPAGL